MKVWYFENVSFSWGESIFVPISKNGLRSDYNNHTDINLPPIASKVLTSVILPRLYNTREGKTRKEHAGF